MSVSEQCQQCLATGQAQYPDQVLAWSNDGRCAILSSRCCVDVSWQMPTVADNKCMSVCSLTNSFGNHAGRHKQEQEWMRKQVVDVCIF